jgi:hyperosmotically inducible protein
VQDLDGDGVDEVGPGPDAPVNDVVGTDAAVEADEIDTDGNDVADNDADVDTDVDADAAIDGSADLNAGTGAGASAAATASGNATATAATDGTAGTDAPMDDALITSKVKTQLLADETVSGLDIDVDTQENVVTLSGTVKTAAEREAAIRIASATAGVLRVIADALKVGY